VGGEVELSVVVVETEGSSVKTDQISKSVDNWEVLKAVSVDDDGSVLVTLGGGIKGWVNNFEGADVLFLVHFVWE